MSDEEKKKTHPLQRAWAAGVFEARATMPKSGYVLRFESTDEYMMKRFHEAAGVGHLDQADKKQCSRPVFIFRTSNMDDTREVLLMMSPFLSALRIKQASDIIGRIERNAEWRRKNPEKAASSVISPAPTAEAETTEQNTPQDGHTVSPPDAE